MSNSGGSFVKRGEVFSCKGYALISASGMRLGGAGFFWGIGRGLKLRVFDELKPSFAFSANNSLPHFLHVFRESGPKYPHFGHFIYRSLEICTPIFLPYYYFFCSKVKINKIE
jgi:hypothetical protein